MDNENKDAVRPDDSDNIMDETLNAQNQAQPTEQDEHAAEENTQLILPDESDNVQETDGSDAEKDILLQDLTDVAADAAADDDEQPAPPEFSCSRCGCALEQEALLCYECTKKIQKYPVSAASVLLAVVVVLFSLAGTCLFAAEFNIVKFVYKGDVQMKADNLQGCYDNYSEAYSYASALNSMLPTFQGVTYFTSGTDTLSKNFVALNEINGPYTTGESIEKYFGENVPRRLKDIMVQYESISKTVTAIDAEFTPYYEGLGEDAEPSYDEMIALVDKVAAQGGHEEYMLDYFRYTVAKQLEQPVDVRLGFMEKVISQNPDAMWLYQTEAISLYKETGDFETAFAICGKAVTKNPTDDTALAMSMSVLRMQGDFEGALKLYDAAKEKVESSIELERQKALVLMLSGKADEAQTLLLDNYDISTLTLAYAETMCACFIKTGNTVEYDKVIDVLTQYEIEVSDMIVQLKEGKITLEDIYMKGDGEAS